MKTEIDKLGINKLFNVPIVSGVNNLKIKLDDLDVGKLKAVSVDLKKISDVVSKEIVKRTVYNKLNAKLNNLEIKTVEVLL